MSLFQKKQKFFKSVLSVFLVAELFLTGSASALAGVKIPSASSIAGDLENRYHLNLQSIQNQGEGFNVSDDKKIAPEVSLFFSPSDPKPGAKLSAKAFPIYFSNTEEELYYTWYLKRDGCDLTDSPSAGKIAACDRDGDEDITVEDWKIEATQILVQNGFDTENVDYGSDTDDDGYRAKSGGGNKTNVPNHCYAHEAETGKNYEFVNSLPDDASGCSSGTPVCVVEQDEVEAGEQTSGEDVFSSGGNGTFFISGFPTCSSSALACDVGTPRCAASTSDLTSVASPTACTAISKSTADPYCFHLFPDADGRTSGDGSFGTDEEEFWGTDPNDPDTANIGNKDEANVVGLGQSTFTWNYDSGDQVGVAVEGTSMIPTKHADSSYMIMWAFPKKNCPVLDLADKGGSYVTTIRGYAVSIPAVKGLDLNKCIEKNLVDPTEAVTAKNLEIAVSATPDKPLNDPTADKGGDLVIAQASISNSDRGLTDTLFDWKVEISDNIRFDSKVGDTADITGDLRALGLVGNVKGNALDAVKMKLDMPNTIAGGLAKYLADDIGYLRFSVKATENVSDKITRRGRSDVIVKFISTGKKITAYKVIPVLSGSSMRVKLPSLSSTGDIICGSDPVDRNACRVIRNEIVGLRIDPEGLSSFNWTVNGQPLVCSASGVSGDCSDSEQNHANFFPITGSAGNTYTVSVTANNVVTGKSVTLSRLFHVVDPAVSIVSLDRSAAWPKLLGQYRDIAGQAGDNCPGGLCNDYSTSIFQAFSGSALSFKAEFLPSFLGSMAEREWYVDGVPVAESDTDAGEISFTADKAAGGIYDISLGALAIQSPEIRRALLDIWNVSPLDSPEIRFSASNQIELHDPDLTADGTNGQKKFLAAIASYIPASVMFTFRILLSAALILFVTGFLFALVPEQGRRREDF